MPCPKQAVSCRYHYDPLDRLTGTDQTGEANAQRFYQKTHLVTEIQGELQRTIFQHDDQLLAQHQKQGTAAATLLATDQQRSVLHTLDGPDHKQQSYSAYGHRPAESGLNALLGFNGERRDPVTGCYMLGNGYRAFNPVLMRFNSPDSLSPFGDGGLNGYAYCQGDPVSFVDPTGHIGIITWRGLARTGFLKVPKTLKLKRLGRAVGSLADKPLAIGTNVTSSSGVTSVSLSSVTPPTARRPVPKLREIATEDSYMSKNKFNASAKNSLGMGYTVLDSEIKALNLAVIYDPTGILYTGHFSRGLTYANAKLKLAEVAGDSSRIASAKALRDEITRLRKVYVSINSPRPK